MSDSLTSYCLVETVSLFFNFKLVDAGRTFGFSFSSVHYFDSAALNLSYPIPAHKCNDDEYLSVLTLLRLQFFINL